MVRNPLLYDLNKCHKLLDQLENLIPVWKCVETELPSISCLNNLEKTLFRNMSSHRSTASLSNV